MTPAGLRMRDFCYPVINYAKFLNQTPTLGDFIPCDLKGNVLEKPRPMTGTALLSMNDNDYKRIGEYQAALERVKFEDFEMLERNGFKIVRNGKYCAMIESDDGRGWIAYREEHKTYADMAPYVTLKPKK